MKDTVATEPASAADAVATRGSREKVSGPPRRAYAMLVSVALTMGILCVICSQSLGYPIRALVRVGRAEYARVVKTVQQTPEVINAYLGTVH